MSEAFLIRIATTRIPKRDTEAVGKRIYNKVRRKILCKHLFGLDKNIGNKQRIWEENQALGLPVLAVLPSEIVGMHVRRHECRRFCSGMLLYRQISCRLGLQT
jgi:hypothetical protein